MLLYCREAGTTGILGMQQTTAGQPDHNAHTDLAHTDLMSVRELSDPKRYRNAPEKTKRKIRQEMNQGLFDAVRLGAIASILLSHYVAFVLAIAAPLNDVLIWYFMVNALSIARHLLTHRYLKLRPPYEEQAAWRRALLTLTALLGICWSGVIWIIWDIQNLLVCTFAIFTVSALAGSAYATLGNYLKAFLATLACPFLALMAYLAHLSSGYIQILIIMTLTLFPLALFVSSTNATRLFHGIFVLLHENHDLMRDIREKSALLTTTLHVIADGVITTDDVGTVTYINPAAEMMTGYTSKNAQGKLITDLLELKDEAKNGKIIDLPELFKDFSPTARKIPGELILSTSEVENAPVSATLSVLQLANSSAAGFVLTLHDVSSLRTLTRDLSFKAMHDPLTGLLNRRGFETCMSEALSHSSTSHQPKCLCVLDLDHFKRINDICGHDAGDEVLRQVVTAIDACIRDTDHFARLGGDEFALIIYNCTLENACKIARSIIFTVQNYRYNFRDQPFSLGVSIGLTPFLAGDTHESLILAADKACYKAKENGRNQFHVADRQIPRPPDDTVVT